MKTEDLIAIDIHTHAEVSCRNPFDSYGEEYDPAADKYFRSSRRPTMQETIAFYREQKIGFVNFTVDAGWPRHSGSNGLALGVAFQFGVGVFGSHAFRRFDQ